MSPPRRREPATSWEGMADWYREIAGRRGPELVSRVLYPEVLRLAGRLASQSVLDVGCGPGALARLLAYRGAEVTGVDASEQMIELARRDAKEAGLTHPPRFEVPRHLRFSDSPLPRTASGKIFKRQLREHALSALEARSTGETG